MGGGDGSRYDSELAALAREKYLWNFWEQPIPTKTFCGQAADVHVNIANSNVCLYSRFKGITYSCELKEGGVLKS